MFDIITDESVVDGGELAKAMRVCRSTVCNWKNAGYKFEFGNRTTPGHLKNWLREQAQDGRAITRAARSAPLKLTTITDPKVLEQINAMAKGVRA